MRSKKVNQRFSCFSQHFRKKGSEKYYIVISLILGLMILTISLFWIFGEYFREEDIDWEICRQSILVRAAIPDTSEKAGVNLKDVLALKCKTQVIDIEGDNYDEINRILADTVASCWYAYGEGQLDFVATRLLGRNTYAMVCARLRFTPEVLELVQKKEFKGDPSFESFYRNEVVGNTGRTYEQYLPYYDFEKMDGGFLPWIKFVNPSEEDYFVVYTQYKHLGIMKIGDLWFWGKEQIKNSEKPIIQLIPAEYLNDALEGEEVLTIPA